MFCTIVKYETENLIKKRFVWILIAVYTLFSAFLNISNSFRDGYFPYVESVAVMLINLVLPLFLGLIAISSLPTSFTEDRVAGIDPLSQTCLLGKKKRNTAKALATILFSIIICVCLVGITLLLCYFCNHLDWNVNVLHFSWDLELIPVWPAYRHILFSTICLLCGNAVLSLFMLFISHQTATATTAIGATGMVVIFEFVFFKFSFPALIKEINICVMLQPYYLFSMNLFRYSPTVNFVLIAAVHLPICLLVFRQIQK